MAKSKPDPIYVVLNHGITTPFNRSVRDKGGSIVETLSFQPGIPMSLDGEQLKAVAQDIGNTLVLVSDVDDEGRFKVDRNSTDEVILAIAKSNTKSGVSLSPIQVMALDAECSQKKPETASDPTNPADEFDIELEELESDIEQLTESLGDCKDDKARKSILDTIAEKQEFINALAEDRAA